MNERSREVENTFELTVDLKLITAKDYECLLRRYYESNIKNNEEKNDSS